MKKSVSELKKELVKLDKELGYHKLKDQVAKKKKELLMHKLKPLTNIANALSNTAKNLDKGPRKGHRKARKGNGRGGWGFDSPMGADFAKNYPTDVDL